MSVSIDDLPLEIIDLILSKLDPASLLSVIRTARFLRPHAERWLYRKVDLQEIEVSSSKPRTIAFLNTVIRNPRLGSLVASFRPHSFIDCANTDEFDDLFTDAAKSLPNLRTLVVGRQDALYPRWLGRDFSQAPPFHLRRLSMYLCPASTLTLDDARLLLEVIQRQPSLSHVSIWLHGDATWDSSISESDWPSISETNHPSLDILEGNTSVIRLLLPRQRVKSLYWEYDRPEDELLRPAGAMEMDSRLRDTLFTPELCEAYRRLENLVLHDKASLFSILSPYLSSLKTLFITTGGDDPHSAESKEALFMRAVGEMGHLEVLEVTWIRHVRCDIDPKAIFAACRKLKRFSLTALGLRTVYRVDDGKRGKDGSVRYTRYCTAPRPPMYQRFEMNWFYF